MATIALFPWPEPGHGVITACLANRLKAQHRVLVCSHIDIADFYRSRGLSFVPLVPALLPKGTFAVHQTHAASPQEERERIRLWHYSYETLLRTLQRESLQDLLGIKPDLALVDAAWPHFALVAYRDYVPTSIYSTALPLDWDPAAPPASTLLVPNQTWWSRPMAQAAWLNVNVRRSLRAARERLRGRVHDTAYLPELARQAGFPRDAIEPRNSSGRPWTLKLPELVMCPQEFDFPRTVPLWRHYVEPCIDVAIHAPRKHHNLLTHLPDGKPLIYCALGTQSALYGGAQGLLAKILCAAAMSPEWHFLLSGTSTELLGKDVPLPDNATLVSFAPQLQVLQRAAVMITHGGLASIKECIWSGVPMVVFPFAVEQPGNAARVQYHQLGVHGNAARADPGQIRSMIQHVLVDASIRASVSAMSELFHRKEVARPSLKVVDSLLEASTTRPLAGC